jgi:hypothetical protein
MKILIGIKIKNQNFHKIKICIEIIIFYENFDWY